MSRYFTGFLFLVTLTSVLSLSSCKKDYLEDAERTALFAPPTDEELALITNDWQNRDLTPTDYAIVQQTEIYSGDFTFKIVSYKVGGIQQYGALVIPKASKPMPVQILVGGYFGSINSTVNSTNLVIEDSIPGGPKILAIPALRGQSLEITINGETFTSPLSEGNQCDAFDEATDDVLAFLNVIQQTEPTADVNRTAVRGGSRGGTVAMLAGIRDPRVKRVIGIVSPVNMHELTAQNENDPIYQCQFLSAYKNGQETIEEARIRMIASSPLYFCYQLPQTQLHMGLRDDIVPIQQAYDLESRLHEAGIAYIVMLFAYDKTHTDIATDNSELSERIQQFLVEL